MRMQYLLDARHTSGRVRSPSPEGVGGHGRLVLLTSGETHRVKPAPSTWVDAEPIRSLLSGTPICRHTTRTELDMPPSVQERAELALPEQKTVVDVVGVEDGRVTTSFLEKSPAMRSSSPCL